MWSRRLLLLILAPSILLPGADLKPETSAAFDRYVKLSEEAMQARSTPANFLWLDQHPKEKTMVWMSQGFVIPQETLDHGQKIVAPDGSIQHWLGVTYLELATLERVRDTLLDYGDYKNFFKQQITESKLVKREDPRFDSFLRLHKKQITQLALNVDMTAEYKELDPKHTSIFSRSTRIGEAPRPAKKEKETKKDTENKKDTDSTKDTDSKKNTDSQEPFGENQNGYLWRLNIYWRLEQADVGVFVELETISLSRATGTLHPGRYLNGFETFPRELTDALIAGLETAFPAPHK